MNESERSCTSLQLEDMETLISNMRLSRDEDDDQGVDNTSSRPSCPGGTTKFTERSGSTIDTCHSCESVLVMCNDNDGEEGQCCKDAGGQCVDTHRYNSIANIVNDYYVASASPTSRARVRTVN